MPTKHKPNQQILLTNTDIVQVDGQSVNITASVIFRLFPYPGVVIESEETPLIVFQMQKERFEIALRNGARLEVMTEPSKFPRGKCRLVPSRQPVDVFDKGLPLRKVNFGILNFPELLGNQSLWSSEGRTIPHAKLETSNWCVEITGVPNISDIVKTLKQDGGYGLTYNGVVTHSHGAEFSVKDVQPLLTALRVFLSFARGASSSLVLVKEYGEALWLRWGAHYVVPWKKGRSWFRLLNGADILSELFPKFWHLLLEDEGKRKDAILRAIDWYLQSNVSAPYVGLLLTQAALERLSYWILENGKCQIPKNGGKGKIIKKALQCLGLGSHLPQNCKKLSESRRWESGPHALVDIRNDLIHPKEKLGPISDYAHHEAWNLGQWYIELILLRMFDYQGSYMNRLAGWHDQDQVIAPVPWVQEPQNP